MQAVFVELLAFERHRSGYLDDEGFRQLQITLLSDPECGDMIVGTGGLRKMRFADPRRRRGKRGGLRIVYFWWSQGAQFWLFTIYGKDEVDDLSPSDKKALKRMLKDELEARA
jgi:hypothetical protein